MTSLAAPQSTSETSGDCSIDADDRLLAQAMIALEQIHPSHTADAAADAAARAADGDAERMLVVRARKMKSSRALAEAIAHVRQAMRLLVSGCVVLALIGGAGAARAALGTPRNEPVNFFHLLAVLLGLQTVLLAIWLYVMVFARRSATVTLAAASLGGLIMALARRLVQLTRHGAEHTAAVTAVSGITTRGAAGKWTFSAISNGLWLAFNIGCLVTIIALLSTRQYAFAWETTILSTGAYVPLTNVVAIVPSAGGFATPTDEQIAASQWKGDGSHFEQASETSQAWSSLLVGSMIVYGFGPRLLLLALCLGKRRMARSQIRLNVDQPEAVRVLERLAPASSSLGVIDADDRRAAPKSHTHTRTATASVPEGPPAILAFEIERPQTPWPPPVHKVRWNDLGFVDDRNARHRVLQYLQLPESRPSSVLVVCGLANTPDRGAESFLRDLCSAVQGPVYVVLTGGQQLRQRSDAVRLTQRVADWRTTAQSAGISNNRVLELDLDYLTHDTLVSLAALVNQSQADGHSHQRRMETAFEQIADFARRVEHQPRSTVEVERLKLHREIAALHRPQQDSWCDLLHIPQSIGSSLSQQIKAQASGELVATLRSSAHRFMDLMPARLKRSPKWLASGAAAGALGCMAAAALISPVAIGSLPIWSALGAVIAAAIQPSSSTGRTEEASSDSSLDSAVRAGALFALVLELQGREEAAITRVLDATLPSEDSATITDAAAAEVWLDDIRHRFDLALAKGPTG